MQNKLEPELENAGQRKLSNTFPFRTDTIFAPNLKDDISKKINFVFEPDMISLRF